MQDRPTRESARAKAIGVISSIRDRHGAAARGLAEAIRGAWPENGPPPEFVVIPSGAAASSAILGALRSPLAFLLLEDAEKLPAALAEPLRAADGEGPPVVHLPEWSNAAAVPPAAIAAVAASLAAMRHSTQRLEHSERRQRAANDTVRRLDRELLEAARLQREFLPRRLPRHPRFECAVLWRPACHVSGDTYEIARLDRDRIGVFIADAVGHGLPAAIVAMGLSKRLRLRDRADPTRLLEPSEVLRQLNEELVACRGEAVWFATASYALFDLRRGAVTVASAGHPPPAAAPSRERPRAARDPRGAAWHLPSRALRAADREPCRGRPAAPALRRLRAGVPRRSRRGRASLRWLPSRLRRARPLRDRRRDAATHRRGVAARRRRRRVASGRPDPRLRPLRHPRRRDDRDPPGSARGVTSPLKPRREARSPSRPSSRCSPPRD